MNGFFEVWNWYQLNPFYEFNDSCEHLIHQFKHEISNYLKTVLSGE